MLRRSKAKTAYDLLTEIKKLIRVEPKRIHMNYWKLTKDEENVTIPPRGFPSCGTVACVGGWVETLTGSDNADLVLGLTETQHTELFYPRALLLETQVNRPNHGIAQTAEHARHVVAHISGFQKKYAAQLKARKIR